MVNIERKNLKKRKSKGSHIKRYGIDFSVSKITQAGDTQPEVMLCKAVCVDIVGTSAV